MKWCLLVIIFSFGACGSICGDRRPTGFEECDDENDINGDGCDVGCQLSCGNGIVDAGAGEECDFGDLVGFGCDTRCRFICGDSLIEGDEECDDGLLNSNTAADACRRDCKLPSCGDQTIDAGEVCDRDVSNFPALPHNSGDGCREDCQGIEVCGDGLLDVLEGCDDGNLNDGDGCSATCVVEGATCGNGVVDAGELCYLPSSLITNLFLPPSDIAIGDINNDGLPDLAFASEFFILTFLQDALGFSESTKFSTLPTGVALVDVSNDGALDLIITTAENPALTIFLNNGAGTLIRSQELDGFGFDQIIPGDFDNDGDIDLAFDELSVALNDGTGHFSEPPASTLDFFPYFAVAGDLDGDNDLDMITAAQGSIVSINKNNGDASFSTSQTFIAESLLGSIGPNGVFPFLHPFALDDIDEDGDLDLVASTAINSSGGKNQIAFFFNDSGTFREPVFTPLPSVSSSIEIQSIGGEKALLVVDNDFSPDKIPHSVITVYRLNGTSIEPRANLSVNVFMFSFGIGDLNLDGAPDFVGISIGAIDASIFLSNP
jgi:cysteine-rich repeat protein